MTQTIDSALAQSIDAVFAPHFRSDTPGAALIVTRDGQPLYAAILGFLQAQSGPQQAEGQAARAVLKYE